MTSLKIWMLRLRYRLGAWVIGGDWGAMIALLWITRDRALKAVREDGNVILGNCPALAEALYTQIPGQWSFSVSRTLWSDAP